MQQADIPPPEWLSPISLSTSQQSEPWRSWVVTYFTIEAQFTCISSIIIQATSRWRSSWWHHQHWRWQSAWRQYSDSDCSFKDQSGNPSCLWSWMTGYRWIWWGGRGINRGNWIKIRGMREWANFSQLSWSWIGVLQWSCQSGLNWSALTWTAQAGRKTVGVWRVGPAKALRCCCAFPESRHSQCLSKNWRWCGPGVGWCWLASLW